MCCSDDELIYLYRQGNDWAFTELENKYLNIIRISAASFGKNLKNTGFELDECVQECLICFYQSLDYYCEIKNAAFATYFHHRMNYTMINYRKNLFHKSRHENAMEKLTASDKDTLEQQNQRFSHDPAKMLSYDFEVGLLEDLLLVSKGIERAVILCLLRGENSREMGKHLPIEQRKINNALYRIRKKLRIVHQKFD